MSRRHPTTVWIVGPALFALAVSTAWGAGPTPKYGRVLNVMHREDPPSLSIHEEATVSAIWGVAPCYNNLVSFDPLRWQDKPSTIVGELAEKWAWGDGGKSLAFSLRRGVRWHDGRPFTSKDVQYTFDLARGAPGVSGFRLNPRKIWWAQIQTIDTPDPYTAVFRLKRPQPALLMLLASGYSPVYPAHIPAVQLRTGCVGTGPFKLRQYRPGELIEFVQNPEYFMKGRPYLDGIRFIIIKERSTRVAALQAGQLDAAMPQEITKDAAEQLRRAVPGMAIVQVTQSTADNLLVNFKRAPFTDSRVRRALSLAIDRRAYMQAVRQGGAAAGASMLPRPWGAWGLTPEELAALPGTGNPATQKAEARRLLAEAGFGPGHPLRFVVSTRSIDLYLGMATYVLDQFRQLGADATLRQIDSAVWFGVVTRGEYDVGANVTLVSVDDPDSNFYENYVCGSPRNYSQYCNPEVDRMIDEQSQMLDQTKRRQLVVEIEKRLEADGARPILGWNLDYYAMWPYVRNLVPHQSIANYARLQDVWLDR